MSLSRITTFTASTVDALELNNEFDNIVRKFGNLTVGDTDLGASTPNPYAVASTATAISTQMAAATAAGKYLYLEDDNYEMPEFTIPDGTRLKGAGMDRTRVSPSTGTYTNTWIDFGLGASDEGRDIVIEDIEFFGGLSTLPTALPMIKLNTSASGSSRRIIFNRCRITAVNLTNYIIRPDNDDSELIFIDCEFSNLGSGLLCLMGAKSKLIFIRCRFDNFDTGIVQSVMTLTDLVSYLIYRDCYFNLVNVYTSTYYDSILCPVIYKGCHFNLNNISGLTAVLNLEGDGWPKVLVDNTAQIDGSPGCYWATLDGGPTTLHHNTSYGDAWQSATNYPFNLEGRAAGPYSDQFSYSDIMNYHIDSGVQAVTQDVTTVGEQRWLLPDVGKTIRPGEMNNAGSPLTLGDVYLSIEPSTTNSNKLVLRKVDGRTVVGSALTLMTGATTLTS